MRKDDSGYIVVETIGAFLLFVLMIVSILALVGVVALQARMHHAITQAAQTVSMYSYLSEISNAAENPNDVMDGLKAITGFASIIGGGGSSGGNPSDAASDLFSDPEALVKAFRNGPEESSVKSLIGRYLRNGPLSGDQYLRSVGVSGGVNSLNIAITTSSVSTPTRNETSYILTVRYEVDYAFGGLPLPFAKLRVTQSAATRAWLGGSGVRYTG